jgi:Uma2 family endonuclease
MAVAEAEQVKSRRWSAEEFRRVLEIGLIPDQGSALIDGRIYENGSPHRWSSADFYRLLDHGFFPGQRVELIEGEILEMGAQKNLHAVGIALSNDALVLAFGPGFWVRVQMSLDLSPYSIPDPDLAVVQGTPRTLPLHQNPVSALLIVEVSESTLHYDQETKGSLYARAGIEDYWILNLVAGRLEVYRAPVVDTSTAYGMRFDSTTFLGPGDSVTPLAVPQASIKVADMLP